MLQWFVSFPEFAEFSENSVLFKKNSNVAQQTLAFLELAASLAQI